MRTRTASPCAATSRRVASMPSRRGMRMSMSTSDGRSRWPRSTASRPSAASPTTSTSGAASSSLRKPARTSAWSSAMRTRVLTLGLRSPSGLAHWRPRESSGCQRQVGADLEAAALARAGGQRAAVEGDAFAHPDQPVAGAVAVRRTAAATVVADLDVEAARLVAQPHLGTRGPGVLERVGQALLDDAVRAQVDPGGQRGALALDRQLDGKAGPLDLLDE